MSHTPEPGRQCGAMAGLRLFTSNRMEILIDELAETLRAPLADPLMREVVLVQSRGMQRWVSMELARRHGVCANVDFPFPNRFVYAVFRSSVKDLPEESPFEPANLTWKVMGVLPDCLEKEGFESLKAYLGDGLSDLKLFQLSSRIADLFDQYLTFRPDMILQWERGRESHWQAALWREITKKKDKTHRARLLRAFLDDPPPSLPGLPGRLAVFGISALPPYHLQVLEAVARLADVNLFLMNPCREYWADIASDREIALAEGKLKASGAAPQELYLERGNSLLASMGALGRDFFSLLNELGCEERDLYLDSDERTLLRAVQSDILNLKERGGRKTPIREDDRSVQVHSCHSPMREVEVLQDQLLAMFEADPKLTPEDILVMTPAIGAYAPFIEAVFTLPEDDPRFIPFSIADRGLRQENPLTETFLKLLGLQGSRFGIVQVMDILESDAVLDRFSLSRDDLELIHTWVRGTNIRWGVDARSRAAVGLPPLPENTWRAGLDRMLLGYALPAGGERVFQGILPYDDIEGSDSEVLGNFLDFMEGLFTHIPALGENRTLEEWASSLSSLLDTFFSAGERWERDLRALREVMMDLAERQTISGFSGRIGLDVIISWLKQTLDQRLTTAGFLSGGITFCAMLPMRSIPFKVICLLGMGHDAYPRQERTPSFDLMAERPRTGDRSRRKDDRYLFLETVLSAREILYISYPGQNIQDNSTRPPSVLVSELLDYIEQGFESPGKDVRERLFTIHRLQAFSPGYFQKEGRLFSYSEENFAAACAAEKKSPKSPFIPSALSEPGAEWRTVDINSLCRFFANPARFLLNRRLGLFLEETPAVLDEAEPFTVEGLERYDLRQEMLAKRLAGEDLSRLYPIFLASGALPHGTPGSCLYEETCRTVEAYADRLRPKMAGGRQPSLDIDMAIGGFRLTGRVENLFPEGLLHYRLAKAKVKDRLRAWIHHLVLSMTSGEESRGTILLCEDLTVRYRPVGKSERYLLPLLERYWAGLRRPLRFFPESSWAYANSIRRGKTPAAALRNAANEWEGYRFSEKDDPYFHFCFGEGDPLDEEFRALALEILGPILDHEEKME